MNLCSLSILLNDLKVTEAYLKNSNGLTFKEATLLCALGCGISEPAKIAKDMNLSPSRTSRLISALEVKELVERNPSPLDKRVVNLVLSEKGNKFLEEIGLPIDLLRISVGVENINEIINEFKRLED